MKKLKSLILLISILFIFQLIFSINVNALTQEQYATKINSIIATWEGKKFNDNVWAYSSYSGGEHNSYYACPNSRCGIGAWECLAFARYVFYELYGSCDCCGNLTSLYSSDINSIYDLRVGDGIRYNGLAGWNHSVIIIDTDPATNNVQLLECNLDYDKHLVTQRTEPFSEIKNYLNRPLAYVGGEGGKMSYLIRDPGNTVTTIKGDTTKPTITSFKIDTPSITTTTIKIKAKATDNVGVTGMKFKIWQSGYESDTGTTKWGTYNSSTGYYEVTFTYSDTKKSTKNLCCVEASAYDAKGNVSTKSGIYDFKFPEIVTNLGDFSARIVVKSNNNYCLGISGTAQGSDTKLKTKNLSDSSQIWRFVKNSDNSYKIYNVSTGNMLDVKAAEDDNGTVLWIWEENGNIAQNFFITSYNGGYRLIPQTTKDLKAIDICDGTINNNNTIQLWKTDGANNNAQTWKFEKTVENITLSKSTVSLTTGSSTTLTASVYPTDAAEKNVTWSSSNTSVATVSSSGVVKGIKAGTAIITARAKDGTGYSKIATVTVTDPEPIKEPSVSYRSHVQNIGWENSWKYNGELSGTVGKCWRLEGLQVKLENAPYSGSLAYRSHVQTVGWERTWKTSGTTSGSVGKSLRVEAIQMKLTGEMAKNYDIYYRLQIQDYGWLGWAKNGQSAGSEGHSKKVEAIEIKLVKKGNQAPGSTDRRFVRASGLKYRTHVQNIGWMPYVDEKGLAGTSGKSLRVEAFQLKLTTTQYNGGIRYRGNIQNQGWESWKYDKEESGTNGKGLRMEAFQIELYGDVANYYDVYYRVHVQNIGWMDWAKNGESAGTSGYGYRIESFQIQLVDKGAAAPGSTANAYKSK